MTFSLSEVQLLLSAPQASGGYVLPGSVYNSNGKWVSTTQVSTDPVNSIFPDLPGAQNAAQQVDYQCVFVFNTDTTFSLTNPVAWLPTSALEGTSSITWAVGADTTPASVFNATTGPGGGPQAGFITSPLIEPSTVTTWFAPSAEASGGASLPTLIGPQQVAAIWIRRTATGFINPDGEPITAGFDVQVTFDVSGG
jgi:hypothetical protein